MARLRVRHLLYPDQIGGSPNPNNGRRRFDVEFPLLELEKVFCEDLEFPHGYIKLRGTLFFIYVKFKLVQIQFRFFPHGHETAVTKHHSQTGPRPGFKTVMKHQKHSNRGFQRFCDVLPVDCCGTFKLFDFADYIIPISAQGKKDQKQHNQNVN